MAKEARINHQIRAREVRIIGPEGNQMGIMPLHEALKIVESLGIDLVEVAPEAQPPVCRMMDYGKYRYMQRKKSHGAKKKQTSITIKEVKMGSRTDPHDLTFKVRHIRRFIEKGQRVKVSVFFRGREITHPELGKQMLDGVLGQVLDVARLDISPRLEGRSMAMLLVPK
ncbi:MAG TPA: translation initiation factor IF-3 [Candidatus Binatia bacterium]|nr:translation initiation factor IF-3 [Candidatus Binatia bacterium]